MHKITIFAVSKVPCISFVGLENFNVEIQFLKNMSPWSYLNVIQNDLSWGALFMMLGSVKGGDP